MQSTIGNGVRNSAAVGYLDPKSRTRPNLDILVNTYATRVLPSSKSRVLDIRTIELVPRQKPGVIGKRVTLTASKELILSAGSIGSPQILLNSGIGDKKDLEAVGVKTILDLPDVGKNLTDHMTVPLSWTATGPVPPACVLSAPLRF
jgi:choline dehydrogenase-like flavoprotein